MTDSDIYFAFVYLGGVLCLISIVSMVYGIDRLIKLCTGWSFVEEAEQRIFRGR